MLENIQIFICVYLGVNMLSMYNQKVKFNYDCNKFVDCEYPVESSCIKHQVHELKDIHDKYGGFPESYKFDNTKIHQRWWSEDELDFKEIGNLIGMDVVTVSSIKQPPGQVVPWHRDTFFLLKKKFPDRPQPVRALIMLEDWKVGHYVQHDDAVFTHWSAGDGFIWDEDILHLGANAGMQDKFTLQISGFLKN
jgi:hypothetical protein